MFNKLDQNQASAQKNYNDVNYDNLSSSSASDEDNNQFNISETKNNILKALDDHINKNKEEFKQITLMKQKKNEIYKLAKDLKLDIKNLDLAINEIIKKQHNDYLNTFSSFMDSIRKELTQKLEEMERQAEEKKKANDIRLIKCERDFFRLEAVRLNGICKSFKEKIDELSFRNKLISDELNTLKIKWKESENINKQLLFELESNLQSHKELEQKLNTTQNFINSHKFSNTHFPHINHNQNMENNFNEISQEDYKKIQDINYLQDQLRKTRIELRREKEKSNKALVSLNKIYLERNKYEGIFQNCVEETKKIIFNRRAKENKAQKIKNRTGGGKQEWKVSLSTKFDDFLPSDKMNTLENFIFNEEVFQIVKDIIFSKPKKKGKNMENAKHLINNLKNYDPDWKMKEILENAHDMGENITMPMPIIPMSRSNSMVEKNKEMNLYKTGGSQFFRNGKINLNKTNKFGVTSKISMDLKVS